MIRILLIDHAVDSPRSVKRLLSAGTINQFDLKSVSSTRDILEAFRRGAYDVCVIDSATGNGLKLLAQARSFGITAPVVITVSDSAGETLRAIRNGVADCLIRDKLSGAQIERSICWVVEQARISANQGERERRYLALIENTREIVFTHDLEGNITSINRAAEQMLGYTQHETLKLNIADIVAPKYCASFASMIKQALDARMQTVDIMELVTKHGSLQTVEISVHLIYQQGKPVEIQAVARSITADKWLAPVLTDEIADEQETFEHLIFSRHGANDLAQRSPSSPHQLVF